MVFCNELIIKERNKWTEVTILILIDGFLQWAYNKGEKQMNRSHNPYFNRWFSAIKMILNDTRTNEQSQSLF